MNKSNFPLERVHSLLEPGPVVLLTTVHRGQANVMTMSWHTMLEFTPPLVGCVLSNQDFSFSALRATGECVLNIPTVELATQVVACGNSSGRDTDKFTTFGLTPIPAETVAAPLLAECYANLECRVVDEQLVASYDFFVLQVLKAWVDSTCEPPKTLHHRGWGHFMVAGEGLVLPSRMP